MNSSHDLYHLEQDITELEDLLKSHPSISPSSSIPLELSQLKILLKLYGLSSNTPLLSRTVPLTRAHTLYNINEEDLIALLEHNVRPDLPDEALPIPLRIYTFDELYYDYNGESGHPLYLAACGYVFDVSAHPLWSKQNCPSLERLVSTQAYFAQFYQDDIKELVKVGPVMGRLIS